jgi:hypothetical protein
MVHLTYAGAYPRVQRLEDTGVITGYTARGGWGSLHDWPTLRRPVWLTSVPIGRAS